MKTFAKSVSAPLKCEGFLIVATITSVAALMKRCDDTDNSGQFNL